MKSIVNGNMFQKSIIQQILENNTALNTFKNYLNNLLESYTIQDNVFIYSNNKIYECETGYMVIDSEHDNLQDAIREMKSLNDCIRIIDNKTFQTGHIVNRLYEGENNKIFDIENQILIH